jgi:hypothetical protein
VDHTPRNESKKEGKRGNQAGEKRGGLPALKPVAVKDGVLKSVCVVFCPALTNVGQSTRICAHYKQFSLKNSNNNSRILAHKDSVHSAPHSSDTHLTISTDRLMAPAQKYLVVNVVNTALKNAKKQMD